MCVGVESNDNDNITFFFSGLLLLSLLLRSLCLLLCSTMVPCLATDPSSKYYVTSI